MMSEFLGIGRFTQLDIGNGTLERIGEIDMEQGKVQAMDNGRLTATIDLAGFQLVAQVTAGGVGAVMGDAVMHVHGLGSGIFVIQGPLAAELGLVVTILRDGGGALITAYFGNTEERLPAFNGTIARWGGIAEAGRCQGTLGPSVVDAGNMPVDFVGGGVTVELVANIDEVLDGGNVDVVDRGEVEDNGSQWRTIGVIRFGLASARSRVIPRAVLLYQSV